eukprot:symbB.v1.2.014645.t1/scaffold1074.1/size139831/10
MQRNPSSAKLFAWGCRAFAALALRPPPPPLDAHSGASSDNNYCAGSSNNCTASQPTLDKFFMLLDSSIASERSKDRRSLSAEGAAAALGNDVPLWLFVIRSFLALVPREDSTKTGVPIAPGALRESGLCALGAMRLLCDHADASAAAMKEICAVLPGAPAPLLAWASSALTVLSCDGRHLAEMVLQASMTGSSKRASSESLLPTTCCWQQHVAPSKCKVFRVDPHLPVLLQRSPVACCPVYESCLRPLAMVLEVEAQHQMAILVDGLHFAMGTSQLEMW